MANQGTIDGRHYEYPLLWYLVHLTVIFMLSILLINLLIAIMVSAYDALTFSQEALILLEYVRMCYTLGWNGITCACIYDKLIYYNFYSEDGKVYLIHHVQRESQTNA